MPCAALLPTSFQFQQVPGRASMLIRLLQRILLMIVTVIATSSAIFVLIHAAGDPTQGFLPPGASPEMRAQVRSSLGLDDPIVVQYARFIGRGLRGDFGNSWRDHQPALQSVLARLPATLLLATTAAGIGVLAGVLSGAGGRWSDGSISLIADVVMAVPFVVIGIVLTAILGQSVSNVLAILIVGGWVGYQRILRLQTRSLIRSEFVQASFQFGASRWHVFRRHLIPNLLSILLLLFFQQIAA